jgi:glycosyltransferase involved in cell wall biosynthesis
MDLAHTTQPSVLYVTSCYNVGYRTIAQQIADFQPFLQSDLPILIFTDEDTPELAALGSTNIQVLHLPRAELAAFQHNASKLPNTANPQKDTLAFLQLGHAKMELIARAKSVKNAEAYVWMDMDILRLTKQPTTFIKRLGRVHESIQCVPDKVIIPGCTIKLGTGSSLNYDAPSWRFCGNLFMTPAGLVDKMAALQKTLIEECQSNDAITWDVNTWAVMEAQNPTLFHWYLADHNDSIIMNAPLPRRPKKIMLLTMIKNESKIIRRLIESTLSIADAICVVDTGSTDNTVEVLREYFQGFQIPAKVYNGPEHVWKNFGHNRSLSFLAAVDYCKELGWDADHSYALVLDADMQLVVKPAFQKHELVSNGYKIIQKSNTLEYYNSRFLRIGHPWKCTGVTHEYWDGGQTDTLTMDKVFISDIGDGGCKADKFERDVRLLSEGLKEDPTNARYMFYLAQSYKDNKQLTEAIKYYKMRIKASGWQEEVWYSMYMICKLYAELKKFPEMEKWGLRAYEYYPKRAECIHFLCRVFREKGQVHKAWHYYLLGSAIKRPDDLLFVETDIYTRAFAYERTILNDYIFPHKKAESMDLAVNFLNTYGDGSVYQNLQWFVQKIPNTMTRFNFPDRGDYVATSTSIVRDPAATMVEYLVNVRYVNYRIQPNGSYLMMDDGVLSGSNPVRTRNFFCRMNARFEMLEDMKEMRILETPPEEKHIKGMEDLRLFFKDGQLHYYATSCEYSYNGKIRQHTGIYNTKAGTLQNNTCLRPPTETECEKNWIPYKENRVIYSWNPFRIGHIDEKHRTLIIDSEQPTPKFLQNMRGSTTLVNGEDGYFYGLTHCVMYQQPRKYYHMVVKIDATTDKLVAYSTPFYFVKNAIEYSLGLDKCGDMFCAIVSQNDCEPVRVEFKESDLMWRGV